MHSFEIGELQDEGGQALEIGRVTGTLDHTPTAFAPLQGDASVGTGQRDRGRVVDRKLAEDYCPGGNGLLLPTAALGAVQIPSQQSDDRSGEKKVEEFRALHGFSGRSDGDDGPRQ